MNSTANASLPIDPADLAVLSELAALGVRGVRVVVRVMEVEQAIADVAAGWLPKAGAEADSLGAAIAGGQAVDAAAAAMAQVAPQVEGLARALDRLSRSVRRSLALKRRMEAGWPRAGAVLADDRAAMMRRQVVHGVSAAIGRDSDGEATERLFDELSERLDDPGLDEELQTTPVEEVVRRISRDLGLAMEALNGVAGDADGGREVDTS